MSRTVRALCALAVALAAVGVLGSTGEPSWEGDSVSTVTVAGEPSWESVVLGRPAGERAGGGKATRPGRVKPAGEPSWQSSEPSWQFSPKGSKA
jgi:hypothetical protein